MKFLYSLDYRKKDCAPVSKCDTIRTELFRTENQMMEDSGMPSKESVWGKIGGE